MQEWVSDLLAKIKTTDGVVQVQQPDGTTVSVQLGPDIVQFLTDNADLISMMGADAFKEFLTLVSEKKTDEAFSLLLKEMTPDQIIAQMNANAGELADYNDSWDAFVKEFEAFSISLLENAASKALLLLITV